VGGTSKTTQDTTQQTTPYAPAVPTLNSVFSGLQNISPSMTGGQSEALDQIGSYARNSGGQFLPGINNAVTTALGGGGPDRSGFATDAYNNLLNGMAPTARGDFLNPSTNPWFDRVTNTIGNDVQSRLAATYAGSGRDPAGAGNYGYNLGRGVAEGTAPVFANAYGMERGNQLNAQNALFGAGGNMTSLLSGLDQTRLGNMFQGIGGATQAQNAAISPWNAILQAELQKTGIPLSILSQLAGIAGPLGQQFGTTTGHSTGTQKMSGAQQFATIASGIGSLMPKGPITGNTVSF
jgi:hypothetical protein